MNLYLCRNRISGQKYTLDDEGVIISEKLATLLDVSEGDDIYLEVSSLNYKPVKVMHIAGKLLLPLCLYDTGMLPVIIWERY